MTEPAKFKCAIWAAVSTLAQVSDDKLSLVDQEATCRDVIVRRGWEEAVKPYVVPGASRTRFVNLRDAEDEIPALKQMLDDAQAGKFTLLLTYDFGRFRDLLGPVSKTLAAYGVQLYSVTQPVEPVPPMSYGPHANGTSDMVQTMSQLVSSAQIQDLRDKFRTKMPRRITDRGLPMHIPWGYKKPDGQASNRAAVPVQDPEKVKWIFVMKDLLLNEKKSLHEICEYLESEGVAPPRGRKWWPQTVGDILRNKFFLGTVTFGASKVKFDPRDISSRSRREKKIPESQIIKAPGRHAPLWDMDTYRQIIAEIASRNTNFTGRTASQMTTLLRCAECGAKMWLFYNGPRDEDDRRMWVCSKHKSDHPRWGYRYVLEWVSAELVRRLKDERVTVPVSQTTTQEMEKLTELAELRAQRSRIEQAYEQGGYALATFLAKVEAIDKRVATLEDVETSRAEAEDVRARWDAMADNFRAMLDILPDWIREEDPLTVNRALRVLVDKIIIEREGAVKIYFRV